MLSGPTVNTVETLEPRRLLAASATGTAEIDGSGTLVINGTNRSDAIEIRINADDNTRLDVAFNGKAPVQFDLSAITNGVNINAGNGKDRVVVNEDNGQITLNVTIAGGNGKDFIKSGSGNDLIRGENGKDALWGGAGNDRIYGGNGKDRLFGEDGDDFLDGGNGKDLLDGAAGEDDLRGSLGKDRLIGGAGNDDFDASDRRKEIKSIDTDDAGDNGLDHLADGHEQAESGAGRGNRRGS